MLHGDAEAEREWLLEAEKLVDMFRETRNLFLTSRVSRVLLLCRYGCSNESWYLIQNNPFRGMFPRSYKRKKAQQAAEVSEMDEERMASRLQLDMGTFTTRCQFRRSVGLTRNRAR